MGGQRFKELIIDVDLEKVKIFGKRYVLTFLIKQWNQYQEHKLYRIFVTDALGHITGAKERWIDMLEELEGKKNEVSSEQVINRMKNKFKEFIEDK